jgi:biofilm PGA synthesis lipoprotein PgaB
VGDTVKHRRRRLTYSTALTALSSVLAASYLVAPGYWQWSHAATRVHRHDIVQVDTQPSFVDHRLVTLLRQAPTSSQAAPIILTYHDVGYNPSPYTVTPEQFATQMQLIHDAGWTTLTADQLDGWLNGEPVPPHSVMVTFDDGAKGVWQYADPVLGRLNMHAASRRTRTLVTYRSPSMPPGAWRRS